ncbi:glycosyltransferase family 2 protein [Flavobacterium urumqiense]|uniref:Glycosyltransferase involved in cell wall bisynthesis n=1 Tax=Flavobacterium urumqiense TaxID=935224 RepID=A0A1H6ASK6_9FLAO|nr:glycosyltransferase family 2 protein [Flavobacterium urumqiense]SEG51210.1 Glycosyltransferase involved in cell wall bisynthesis [Flavobacterium urumqiense]
MQITPQLPTISIIIPVFNRDTLLAMTIESIIEQTFTNWECILIDDQSTDDSFLVMKEFQAKDKRIQAYKRPLELKKGANACRNFGFTKSSGAYIKWFDSDDIMLPNHLETAFHTLVDNSLDFVVTDTLNFDHDTNEFLGKTYNFDRNKVIITAENLALMRIGWITDDFLGTREIVENIKFNENITDGDEYNFFVKMLHQSVKGTYVNQIVTHKRIHVDTITLKNSENDINHRSIIAILKFQTALDLVIYNDIKLIRWFLSGYMRYAFMLAAEKVTIPYKKEAFKLICKYYSFSKGFAFMTALFLGSYFKKGYNIMKYARE